MNKVIIIAEAGVNHNGDIDRAKELVDAAETAGADFVKFQTFKASNLASKLADKASYQKDNTGNFDESQLDMLKKLELSPDNHLKLIEYCRNKKINFLSTAFDLESIDYLSQFELPFWKIPSGEITNLPYLRKIGSMGKPVILSTGMSELSEIEKALIVLTSSGTPKERITVLHCNTEYPTPMNDVNLLAMDSIRKEFGVKVGYSDHTLGIEVPIAAVALGASIIEKHFTLDKSLPGPDHLASLDPHELRAMVRAIRNIETALGHPEKTPSDSEIKNIPIARKSIVASCKIKKGELFTEDNLTVKRPGTGISPMMWDEIIGSVAKRDYQEDDLI